ncbi:hypothetical protein ACFVU3_28965 [Streptomyces sp. NPDC058052]|uniref:hypothetical protein n=1 Tax=Streptomyces sp. NPDC058052 TaxID=3346316 RepID=UPI0036ECDCEB
MEVVRPQAEWALADEGGSIRRRAAGGGLVGEAGGLGDGPQQVAFGGCEAGERAGDQGTEVVLEVGRMRGVAGLAELEKPHDGEAEVERQSVGADGDHVTDRSGDERGTVGLEAAGQGSPQSSDAKSTTSTCRAADGCGVGEVSAGVRDAAGPDHEPDGQLEMPAHA